MIDAKKQIVSTLEGILPIYYELYVNADTPKPCITYRELQNAVQIYGDTLGYSGIQYDIKVWGKIVSDLAGYVLQIDNAMREIGYTRIAYTELSSDDEIEIVMTYEGLAKENFN